MVVFSLLNRKIKFLTKITTLSLIVIQFNAKLDVDNVHITTIIYLYVAKVY